MAAQGEGSDAGWFDLARIKQLVRLMRDNDLSEIDLRWAENSRLRLCRGVANPVLGPVSTVAPHAAVAAGASAPPPPAAAESTKLLEIKSPIVGTYYSSSSPDSEPFVKIGAKVSAESIVCIVEAMKVFNEIPAGLSGTVREILVENGAPVEYGQPLYRVEPN